MDKWENTLKALEEYGDRLIENARKGLDTYGYNKGDLYKNMTFTVQVKSGQIFEVDLLLENYWKYVESGRRAGAKMPPQRAMLDFIQKRQIVPHPDKNGRVPTVKQLAFLIGRKISRDGIPPKPFMAKAKKDTQSQLIKQVRSAIAKDMKGQILKEIVAVSY